MADRVSVKDEGTVPWIREDLPDMKGLKVFVLNGAFYGNVVHMFAHAGAEKANSVETADIVVFIGGDDVSPELYNQKKVQGVGVHTDGERDTVEEFFYRKAVALKKPMFGICRGAQFLHVMNGGKLWQHVNNHGGRNHTIVDIEMDCELEATSIHHQMLQDSPDLTVVAVTRDQVASIFQDADLSINLTAKGSNAESEMEIEAGCYENTLCFFVQGHPEVGTARYQSWSLWKLWDFLSDWNAVKDDPELEDSDYVKTVLEQIG